MTKIYLEERTKRRNLRQLRWAAFPVVLVALATQLEAQSPLLSGINPMGDPRGGFQLYGISGFAGWESVVSPQGGGYYLPATAGLHGDEILGAGASAGWSRRSQKSNLSIIYSANYQRQIRYSNLNALSQVLSLNASRHIGAKWDLSFSGTAGDSTYDQMLFSPTLFSSLTAVPATFEDLASAVLAGQYNNNQLASLLTGAPMIDSPSRTLLFGDRVFVSSAGTSLSYAHSQRLTISASATGSYSEHLPNGGGQTAPQYIYLLPHAMEASAGINVSYALTPRTRIGVDVSGSRGFSHIQDSYTSYGTAFVSRKMGQRWFAQVHGGGGFVTYVNTKYAGTRGTTPVFGGSLGFKTYAHSFIVESDQTLSQGYGAGASDTIMTSGAWHWWRPGHSWGLNSMYTAQRFSGGAFGNLSGWRASAGMTRRLGGHMVLETAYTYASFSSSSPLNPYKSAQSAVRLSVMWTPQAERR